MIDLKNMTKDQKQKAVLMAIVGLAAIFAIKQFVLAPLFANRGQARMEYETLKNKLDLANQSIHNEIETTRKLGESQVAMRQAYHEYIPSSDNLLAWATKTIYSQARRIGVDIESVSESSDADIAGFMNKDQARLAFKPYAVRISLQCDFAQLVELVKGLETSNPHLCIAGIDVSPQPGIPDKHQISIVVEWPSWKDPARGKIFDTIEGDRNA